MLEDHVNMLFEENVLQEEEDTTSICIHKRADDQVKSVKQGSDNQSIIDQPVNKPLFCLMTILHINIVLPLEIISVLKLELREALLKK